MSPIIKRWEGITIVMNSNEHEPPHVHVSCAEHEARVGIRSHRVIKGFLPPAKRRLAEEWVERHREALLKMWENRTVPGGIERIKE